MSQSRKSCLPILASVAAMVLLTGCQSSAVLTDETLASSVSEMTRGDVTQGDEETTDPRQAVDLGKGYGGALRAAILHNPEFMASISRYRESGAAVVIAEADTRPQLTGSATAGGLAEGDASGITTGGTIDASLSQLIFDGGAARANIAGATARAYAARANIAVSGNTVGRDAAMAWIDLWQANTHKALLDERVRDVEPLIKRIERLIDSGIVDRASLASAQRQFLDLKLEQERLTAERRDAQERFNRYFGVRPNSLASPKRLFSDTELAQIVDIWPESPELVAAAAELIAAERAVEGAQAQTRPNVSLQVGASSPLSSSDESTVNARVVLQHSFFDGGRRKAEVTRLTERLEAGRAAFEDTKAETRVTVENALSRHRSLRGSISVLQAQIRALDTERSTRRSQIASGQADMYQLVESEVQNYRTRARLLEVRGELMALEMTIASLTGQLVEKLAIHIDGLL